MEFPSSFITKSNPPTSNLSQFILPSIDQNQIKNTNSNEKPENPDWETLLRSSQNILSCIDSRGLPIIQRNINQLEEVSRRLARQQTRPISDTQGLHFLTEKGFDCENQNRLLNSFDLSKLFASIAPISQNDVEKYLQQQHELNIKTAIEESHLTATKLFGNSYLSQMSTDWEQEKLDCLEKYGFPFLSLNSQLSSPLSINQLHLKYASVIQELNRRYSQNLPFGIVSSFLSIFNEEQNHHPEIKENWLLLKYLLQEHDANSTGDFLKNPLNHHHYRSSDPENQKSIDISLIKGSLSYSQNLFQRHIQYTISHFGHNLQHGGVPGLLPDVRTYIQFILQQQHPQLSRRGSSMDLPSEIWMELYYSLRCGSIDSALQVVTPYSTHPSLEHVFNYLKLLSSDPHCIPDFNLLANLEHQYKTIVKEEEDPYRIIVLSILSYCELLDIDLSFIFTSFEDWIWLQLKKIWIYPCTPPGWLPLEQHTLVFFKEKAGKYYHENFQYFSPLQFFRFFTLCLSFEQAVFLLSQSEYFVDSLHMGIALEYYGLLNCDNTNWYQLNQNKIIETIDLWRLVKKYAFQLSSIRLDFCCHYLLLIRPLKACSNHIVKILHQTSEFDQIIGDSHKPGLIPSNMKPEESRILLTHIAETLFQNNCIPDSIRLFLLLEDVERAHQILLNALSLVVNYPQNDNQRQLLLNLIEKYHLSDSMIKTLLQIVHFFNLFHDGLRFYDEALQIIENLKMLPLTIEKEILESRVNFYKSSHSSLQNVYPLILLATMTILSTKYQHTAREEQVSHHNPSLKQVVLTTLSKQASALVNFSTLIQCPSDITTQLIQYESITKG